jgi:hypothetical protein
MPRAGASDDPKWIENELEMLERTFNMYKVYASNANTKDEKTAWDKRLKGMEERIDEVKKKLEKARQRLGIKAS